MQFGSPASDQAVSEVDYFYWPCMAGEKYAPSFGAAGSYSSLTTYPAVAVGSAALAAATWPAVAPWSLSKSAYAGFTLSFRAAAGASNSNNGPALYLNPSKTEYIRFLVANQVGAQFNGGFNNLFLNSGSGNVLQNRWYSVSLAFAAAGTVTVTIDGKTFGPFVSTAGATVFQAILDGVAFGGGVTQGFISQMKIEYN